MLEFVCILGTVLFVAGLIAASSKKVKIICGILAIISILCLIKACDDIEGEQSYLSENPTSSGQVPNVG